MRRPKGTAPLLTAVVVLWAAFVAAPAAAAELSADEVAARIADTFAVRVLRVQPAARDGRDVFVVTVMNPPGDFNEAFKVTRLMVDRATGKLVSQFRNKAAGHDFSAGGIDTPMAEDDGAAIRRLGVGD